jgi:hypothetical protein
MEMTAYCGLFCGDCVRCGEKQYAGCWECESLHDCNKFDFLKPFHGETPKNNCIDLLNNGFDSFPSGKHAFYIWDKG